MKDGRERESSGYPWERYISLELLLKMRNLKVRSFSEGLSESFSSSSEFPNSRVG
jgi:hypothetical protein